MPDIKQQYKNVFSGKDVEAVIKDLMTKYYFDKPSFTGDALTSAYNEGQRSVVLYILKMIETKKEKQIKTETPTE